MSSFLSQVPPSVALKPGRYGAASNASGVTAKRRDDVSLATLVAGRGVDAALAAAVRTAFGAELPTKPVFVEAGGAGFIGTGPGRWTVASDLPPETLLEKLEALGAAGSATDQSDGAIVYDLSGTNVRSALAKLVNIDIDPVVFKAGSAATTRAALIGVTFWAVDETTIRLTVARSYATAFLRALAGASVEYGFELN